MKYTYLLIDLFSVLVPFIFSFHPRLKFYKRWPALFPAMFLTGIFFIGWDMYFTSLKVWGFNPDYLTGIWISNLPLEEILFFLCIPYSCMFTYACLGMLWPRKCSQRSERLITALLIAGALLMIVCFYGRYYTVCSFALLAVLLFIAQYLLKVPWLSGFYITYAWLLLPFVLVNGLLTGTGMENPVVWYNSTHIITLRILTIPVEDVFYGMDLILLNVIIYSLLSARSFQRLKLRRKARMRLINVI